MKFELEQRAIRGDQEAILSLIEMDEDILYRMAFTYMKNEQDAMDVMQEPCLQGTQKNAYRSTARICQNMACARLNQLL